MISTHALTDRIRNRSHRRPSQRRSHHNDELRPASRVAGRGAFFASCPPDEEGIERVIVIPERPRLFWPAPAPEGFRGQLDGDYQRHLAAERAVLEREDCSFEQTCILSSGEAVEGEWDFRGREDPYLGMSELSNRRVLDIAPGSGYFGFHMERNGAEVVCFDTGFECLPDVMPQPGEGGSPRSGANATVAFRAHSEMRALGGVQNAWWYLHRDYGSSAAMVYGDLGHLPDDLGVFDMTVFEAILSKVRDPWRLLAQAAPVTRQRMVVADMVVPAAMDISRATMEHAVTYAPHGADQRTRWWGLSPGAVADALRHIGFSRTRVIFHSQRHQIGFHWSEMPMFTVVADRDWSF